MLKIKYYFLVIILLLMISCESLPVKESLPDWEKEQNIAKMDDDSEPIESLGFSFRRIIHNMWINLGYEAHLFNYPIKLSSDSFLTYKGLTSKEFPRKGSVDDLILWECINDFKELSGARPGDYFIIFITELTDDEFNSNPRESGTLIMFFLGRFEQNDNIRGEFRRKI